MLVPLLMQKKICHAADACLSLTQGIEEEIPLMNVIKRGDVIEETLGTGVVRSGVGANRAIPEGVISRSFRSGPLSTVTGSKYTSCFASRATCKSDFKPVNEAASGFVSSFRALSKRTSPKTSFVFRKYAGKKAMGYKPGVRQVEHPLPLGDIEQ